MHFCEMSEVGFFVYLKDVLKIESSFDWAIRDLPSFEFAHKERLTRKMLRKLGHDDGRFQRTGGCNTEFLNWKDEELDRFFDTNFKNLGDWARKSPSTYAAYKRLEPGRREAFKARHKMKIPVQWSKLSLEEILDYLKSKEYRLYSEIPFALRRLLKRPEKFHLLKEVTDYFEQNGCKKSTKPNAYKGKKFTKEDIIERVKTLSITSMRDCKIKDPYLYNRLAKPNSETMEAIDDLLNNNIWNLDSLDVKRKSPEEYRKIAEKFIKQYLGGNHRSPSLRSLNTSLSGKLCKEGVYKFMSFFVLVNVVDSPTDSKMNKYYYWSESQVEKFIKLFEINLSVENFPILTAYLKRRGLLEVSKSYFLEKV